MCEFGTQIVPGREPTTEAGACPWEETPAGSTQTSNQPVGTTQSSTSGSTPEPDSSKVKKPSIAVASTSEGTDVCPWDVSPQPESTEKTLDVTNRSRKNSTQFDSGSSSSDISLAIVEVSDRLRRTCGITQQNTLDDSKFKGRKLSTASCIEPRRSSVSIPPAKYSERPSVSSFEESGSCTQLVTSTSDVSNNPSERDNNEDDEISSIAKTSSISGAPIISVSSVLDDSVTEPSDVSTVKEISGELLTETSTEDVTELKTEIEIPLAPLAVPDSESPGSDFVPDLPQEQLEEVDEVKEVESKEENKECEESKEKDTKESDGSKESNAKEKKEVKEKKKSKESKDTKSVEAKEVEASTLDSKQNEICPWEDE